MIITIVPDTFKGKNKFKIPRINSGRPQSQSLGTEGMHDSRQSPVQLGNFNGSLPWVSHTAPITEKKAQGALGYAAHF